MAERYEQTCKVCGLTEPTSPGWCKIISYDADYNKHVTWLCPKHYDEMLWEEEKRKGEMKCVDHPRYRGINKPRAVNCEVCNRIWNARKRGAKASSSGSGSSKT